MRKYLSAAVSLLFFSGLPFGASGEVNWLFQVGGMYMKQYGAEGKFFNYETGEREKGKSFEATAGLYLQIPVSKSVPVYIETGLGYRNKLVLSQAKGFKFKPSLIEEDWLPDEGDLDYYRGNIIEIPVKAGYALALNEHNSFEFGFGPYVGFCTERGNGDPLLAGLTASAAYRHRCMSFGFSYANPVFVNGPRNYYTNSINFTIGINFGSGAWSTIGNVAMIAGSVAGGVAQSYVNAYGQSAESSSDYSSGSYSSSSQSEGYSRNGGSRNVGNKYDTREQENFNAEKRAYEGWDSQLSMHFSGNRTMSASDVRHAQSEMKRIREKWKARGKNIPKSSNETR